MTADNFIKIFEVLGFAGITIYILYKLLIASQDQLKDRVNTLEGENEALRRQIREDAITHDEQLKIVNDQRISELKGVLPLIVKCSDVLKELMTEDDSE